MMAAGFEVRNHSTVIGTQMTAPHGHSARCGMSGRVSYVFYRSYDAPEPAPKPAVLGFLVQCSVCPQQALVAAQPDGEWLCPRCAEVAERAPVRLPAEFDTPSGLAAEFDDDEYPLGKVRG